MRPVEIHLPLVRRQYLLPVLGSDHESREDLSLDIPGVKLRPEKLVGARSLSFCLIHCSVCALDQGIRSVTVFGVDTDANAPGQAEITPGDGERSCHRGENLFRSKRRISRIRDFWKQDYEFIPTETAYGVRTAHASRPRVSKPTAAVCRQTRVPGYR